MNSDVIHLRINSPGGDIFAARAIQTAIKQHKAKVVAHIDGIAASAASFIAMGADEIEIVDGGFIMIHKALSFFDILGYFNDEALEDLAGDMQKERDLLAKVDDSIANDYAKRTSMDKTELLGMMHAETWLTAEEALKMGFADRVYDGVPVENSYDLSVYGKVPDELKRSAEAEITKRDIERALRDVGLTQAEAKSILAKGWQEVKRDVEPTEPIAAPEPAKRDVEPPAQGSRVAALLAKGDKLLLKSTHIKGDSA